jgi:hypothetical protein
MALGVFLACAGEWQYADPTADFETIPARRACIRNDL